jgi:hypothetical protein
MDLEGTFGDKGKVKDKALDPEDLLMDNAQEIEMDDGIDYTDTSIA